MTKLWAERAESWFIADKETNFSVLLT